MLTQSNLTTAFRSLGLQEGDTVLVHSSLRKLGPVENGADGVIDALLAAVGPAGTVAVPTHTWGTVNARQPVFHQLYSPSIVGTLTNIFRQRPEAVRGLHPTHSVAAIGVRAAEFVSRHEQDNTPCSRRSPYGKLVTWGGKILFIGVNLECCTFFHGCEEWADCPWVFTKEPEFLYSITAAGKVIPVPSYRHAHDNPRCYPALETPLLDACAMVIGNIGDCPLRLLDARKVADYVISALRKDPCLVLQEEANGRQMCRG
ncbi:MAG: AAC(3) family N-acetyltransferase [Armatimonadota bacterium]